MTEKLKQQLIFEEGFRSRRYKCTAGKVTIGYGHNCDVEPTFHGQKIPEEISPEYAEALLEHDIMQTIEQLRLRFPKFFEYDQARRDAFTNMAFQMGVKNLVDQKIGFKSMLKACAERRWEDAYKHALDSKWAKQDTPNRAKRVAWQIKHGKYYEIPA